DHWRLRLRAFAAAVPLHCREMHSRRGKGAGQAVGGGRYAGVDAPAYAGAVPQLRVAAARQVSAMGTGVVDKERQRKNVRTALVVVLIALASLALFAYKVWQYG